MAKQPLEPLFKELDGFIQEEEFTKVTKTCDKILAIAPNDPDAVKCKTVAFIKLGQFPNALAVIEGQDKKAQSEILFEKAYCLYRTKKYDDALEVIKGIAKPHPVRVLELEAQVRYRLEHYKQCISIYEDLVNNQKVDSSELKTNLCAAYTEAGLNKENLFFVEKNKAALKETFEFAFNAACAFIAVGDYTKAESHLEMAKKVCAESLAEDGYTAVEIQQELAVLQVQLAYCQQLAGQLEAANSIYLDVIKTKSSDQVAMAVATNNSIVLKKKIQEKEKETKEKENIFETHKRLKNATTENVEMKMTPSQRRSLSFNKAILTLQTSKGDQVRATFDQLEKEGIDEESLLLLRASLLVKEKKSTEAEKLLSEFSKKNPQSLRVPLSLAQIYLTKNEFAQTLAVLQGLSEEYRYKPAVVAAISSLYEKTGDIEGAMTALDKYAEWAEKQKDKIDNDELARILILNGEFKLQHKKYEKAYEIFEKVVKKNRNDLKALSQLVIAASHFNPSLATNEERIPSQEVSAIDVDELEKLPAPSLRSKQTTPSAGEEPKQLKKKENKKKKRKPRLPKNHTPGVTPDPERWLPKWQRSSYKKKQQKKVQLGKGSQGVGGVAAPVSLSTPSSSSSSKPAPSSPVAGSAKTQAKKGKKRR